MDLPDLSRLPEERSGATPEDMLASGNYVSLKDMSYELAMKVPGAIYEPALRGVILPNPSARAATVALALQPSIAINHPELVELRDAQIRNVRPVDHATRLQIKIQAPVVHQTLLDEGHDWLEFDHAVNEPVIVPPVPGGHGKLELWPTQETDLGYAAAVLQKHHGFLLGWARGQGKTLGTAAIIEANNYNTVLIASPNSAKFDTWVRELEHRLPSHQIVVMGNGSPAKRQAVLQRCKDLYTAGTPFVLVTHHESLALVAGKKARASGRGQTVLDGWKRLKIQWDLFAVDESHRLKTAGKIKGSQFHRAASKVPADNHLCLTGSIYENSWEELYGQLHILFPRRYQDPWEDWNLRHLDYVDGYGKVFVGILPGHDEEMRQELGVFTIIREKMDRTIHGELRVELSPGQRKAYDDLVETMLARLDDDTLVLAESGVVQLTRLRQVAAGLDLLTDELHDSTKIDRTRTRINEFPDHDFFVATWHKAAAYALAERLEADGYPTFVVTGDIPMRERDRRIAASREAVVQRHSSLGTLPFSQPVVVVGTIATLGESINLQHLNHVISVELSFNPALNRQTVDRVDRTGQLREVWWDIVTAINTVDEYVILPNLANKNAMRAILLGRAA